MVIDMARPSGGILLAAWILVVIGAVLQIILGAMALVGAAIAIPMFPSFPVGALIGAILLIVIGIITLVLRVADQLDEWVWIILAIIFAIIGWSIGGLLVLIGAILAIINQVA